MKRTNKLPEIYFSIAIAAAVILAAVDIILMRSEYQWTLYLYNPGARAPLIFHAAAVFIVALLCTSAFTVRRAMLPKRAAPAGTFVSFCSAMTGCMLAGFGVLKLFYFVLGRYDTTQRDAKLGLAAAVLSIVAAVYFIAAAPAKESRRYHSLPAFAFILTAAVRLVEIYFGVTSPINSPPRIIFEIAMLACMDYVITEARFIVEQPKPGRYVAAACSALVAVTLHAVPSLYFTFTGRDGYSIGPETLFSASMIFFVLYIAGRLARYLSMDAEPDPEPVKDDDGGDTGKYGENE